MLLANFQQNDKTRDTFEYLQNWIYSIVENKWQGKPGVVLFGPTGTGKTHLAVACAKIFIEHGIRCYFLSTVNLPRNDQDLILEYSDAEIHPSLIIDDLGAEKGSERFVECLFTIIDGRLNFDAPTIITTNYKEEQLRERLDAFPGYGARIVGRLHELCEFLPVYGNDKRVVE